MSSTDKYYVRGRSKKSRNSAAGPNGPARVMWTIIDETIPENWYGPYMSQEDARKAADVVYRRRERPIRIVRLRCTEDVSIDYEPTEAVSDEAEISEILDELGWEE